jgi:hypothetical protein
VPMSHKKIVESLSRAPSRLPSPRLPVVQREREREREKGEGGREGERERERKREGV